MPLTISWYDISLRLALTVFAGAVVGLNRGEHGRPAGLRTTILVSLAAAVSMIQANLLLITLGKDDSSFATMDVLRLPLGILSGMGFIGGGAILRRGNMIVGVTTAATLWYVTVMGLCFGGGQLELGVAMLALGIFVLMVLKQLEVRMNVDRRASMMIEVAPDGPSPNQLRDALTCAGLEVQKWGASYSRGGQLHRVRCTVKWRGCESESEPAGCVERLAKTPGIAKLRWKPS
jgi:putative Mg2+ transporter-C (MgtC) family protein